MMVGVLTVRLYAPWVHSLKEKRMEVKSLTARIRNRFNVSVSEVDAQDLHQTICIGIAAIAADAAQADSMLDHIINFIEEGSQAEITKIEREIR